jgi:hypothetical protein
MRDAETAELVQILRRPRLQVVHFFVKQRRVVVLAGCVFMIASGSLNPSSLKREARVQQDEVDPDGYVLAQALRENPQTASVQLIAVTAGNREEDKQRSRDAGFQLHLVKPVRPESLLDELDKVASKFPIHPLPAGVTRTSSEEERARLGGGG